LLSDVVARQPSGQAINVLADHLPVHQTRQVRMWFAQKERDGIVISVQDRDHKLSVAMMD